MAQSFAPGLRRLKTAVVRSGSVPKVYRDISAAAGLYGRGLQAHARGDVAVGQKMREKAGEWAMGNRNDPTKTGNWSGNNSTRAVRSPPSSLDESAAGSRWGAVGAKGAQKAAAHPSIAETLAADLMQAGAGRIGAVAGKAALPLTAASAAVGAISEGARRSGLGEPTDAEMRSGRRVTWDQNKAFFKGAAVGAADAVTLGLASWAYAKFRHGTPVNGPFEQGNSMADKTRNAGERGDYMEKARLAAIRYSDDWNAGDITERRERLRNAAIHNLEQDRAAKGKTRPDDSGLNGVDFWSKGAAADMAANNGPSAQARSQMSPAMQAQFKAADQHYRDSHMGDHGADAAPADHSNDNHNRGTQNETNLKAIIANKQARAAQNATGGGGFDDGTQ